MKKRGDFLKKAVWLIGATVAICGVLGVVGFTNRTEVTEIETVTLSATVIEETVTCKGRVEQGKSTEVSVPVSCVIQDVLVHNGDTVKEGDTLFTVDKEATLSVLAQGDNMDAVYSALQSESLTAVLAPTDGIVGDLNVKTGETIEKDKKLATVSADGDVRIRLSVPERLVSRIRVGQSVKISGIGFLKKQYEGQISEIATKAKQQISGTAVQTTVDAVVKLSDKETDESLRDGLTASAAVVVSTVKDGFLIPYEAVAEDDKNAEYVYVLQGSDVEKREIKPLAELSGGYLLQDGFKTGDQVVLYPETIHPKGKFKVKGEEGADV